MWARTAQPVTVIESPAIELRAKAVVAQAVAEETGVHLLRTSPTMAGIYVRGLTGNKVNVFVDGVRYSTGAARGGVNTFLDLVEPTSLEVDRGPARARTARSTAATRSAEACSSCRRPPSLAGGAGKRIGGYVSALGHAAPTVGWAANLARSATPWGRFGLFANLAGRRIGKRAARRGHRLARRRHALPRACRPTR